MRLGIMQPYFFPYVGYFDVIRKTDKWVVFDVVKYQSKHWMNRNRILEPNKGEQYVTVPVDKRSSRELSDIAVKDPRQAGEKILRQLGVYRHAAPHYDAVHALVEETFASVGEGPVRLRDLNVAGLEKTCAMLGIAFDYEICSGLGLDFSNVQHAGQWALEICDQLGAAAYVNPSGGKAIFKPEDWRARGIDIAFTRMPDFRYEVGGKFTFLPNLSILDCLMWVGAEEVRGYLDTLPLDRDFAA
ncbi:WbqC family protein [Microbaculum sp. FT89]|uniref:WbqC family protein n=1 Tax=Microbaculum sp. FT89 TaxID=3447298 RepID=UPI003F537AB8